MQLSLSQDTVDINYDQDIVTLDAKTELEAYATAARGHGAPSP